MMKALFTPSTPPKRRRDGIPRRTRNKYHQSVLPTNTSVGNCAICGKAILGRTGEPRPYPKSWPTELQIHHDDDSGHDIAHRKCLARIQRLRTEYLSGAIHERWSKAPPLGSPRADVKRARQLRRKKKTSPHANLTSLKTGKTIPKPFTSAVRPPPLSSLGTQISRPSDSLHQKSRVIPKKPPPIIPFQQRKKKALILRSKGGRGTTPQLQVLEQGNGARKKITVRIVFADSP